MTWSIRSVISLSVTRQLELRGPVVVLGALDEEGDGLRLQRLVLGRAGLREGPLLGLVGLLRPGEQRVELRLRDRRAVDDGDRVRGNALVRCCSAGGRDEHGEGNEDGDCDASGLHVKEGSLVGVAGAETLNV